VNAITPVRNAILISFVLFLATAAAAENNIEWINSPEACFATSRERAEWFRLADAAQRESFKRRYWLMRDPSLGTEQNEFRDAILGRVKQADARFSFTGGLTGSSTAQGMIYVVFGPPARVRTNYRTDPGELVSEGTQQEATWIYDQQRTPRLLQMLGRPGLEIVIMIEPARRVDAVQTPGVVAHYREMLAERSVVNPQMETAIAASALSVALARLDAPLPDHARVALSGSRHGAEGAVRLTAGDVSTENGSTAIVTISLPNAGDRTTHLTTFGEIREGDRVAATVAEPFRTTQGIDAAPGSRSTVLRLDLPPGSYDGSFAIMDDRSGETLLAVTTPIRVFDPAADFTLSSMIVGSRPTRGQNDIFTFGDIALYPRADRRFTAAESLWYFATLRAKGGTDGPIAEIQLRRDGKTIAVNSFRPQMNQIATDSFLLGHELPLGQFSPGRYTLYLTIRREGRDPEVRRVDFDIVR